MSVDIVNITVQQPAPIITSVVIVEPQEPIITALTIDSIGIPGAPGSKWYNGTDNPISSLGNNGDYYLKNTTGDIFQKVVGSWTYISNLRQISTSTITETPSGSINGINNSFITQSTFHDVHVGVFWNGLRLSPDEYEVVLPNRIILDDIPLFGDRIVVEYRAEV